MKPFFLTGIYFEDTENMVQVLEMGLWERKASVLLLLPFHVESLARLDRLLTLEQVRLGGNLLPQEWHCLSLEPNSVAWSIYR